MDLFRTIHNCPLCSADQSTAASLFRVRQVDRELTVLRCGNCGLAYKEAFPTPALLSVLYSSEYVHFQKEDGRGLGARAKRMGGKRGRGRHLDYGCGAGDFVDVAAAS